MSNGFLTNQVYIENLPASVKYDVFPGNGGTPEIVSDIVTLDNTMDNDKMAMVNLNVSFNYITDDAAVGASYLGIEVIKIYIVGPDLNGNPIKESCLLSLTVKDSNFDGFRYGNMENNFLKVFIREGQKISAEFLYYNEQENMSIHCGARITDLIVG
jgi:hypothetical protein